MSIDPNIIPGTVTDPDQAAIAELERRVDALSRIYGAIGTGSIDGGAGGHIAALSITAASIAVGSVNADRITSGVLSAAEVLLGSGGKLIAGSAGTGARVVYDAGGIEAYNASNVKTLDIDAATGSISIVGGSLVAGSIYTAVAPSARVEIDSSGIRGIDGAAVEKFRFDTATGSLSLTGVITAQAGSAVPVTYVTSGNIVSGTIITIDNGGYLQTSATNPRVVLDNAGLRAYNASGAVVADVNATLASFTGATFQTATSGARLVMDAAGVHVHSATESDLLTLTPTGGLNIEAPRLSSGATLDDLRFISWVDEVSGANVFQSYAYIDTLIGVSAAVHAQAIAGFVNNTSQVLLTAGDPPAGDAAVTGMILALDRDLTKQRAQLTGFGSSIWLAHRTESTGDIWSAFQRVKVGAASAPLSTNVLEVVGGRTWVESGASTSQVLVAKATSGSFDHIIVNASADRGDFSGYDAFRFSNSVGSRIRLDGRGWIYATNTSVQSVSDGRLKKNVRDLDGRELILGLRPRRFDWRDDIPAAPLDVPAYGFVAQEVDLVAPEFTDENDGYLTVGAAGFIPHLVALAQSHDRAIGELDVRVDALAGPRSDAVLGALRRLEARIDELDRRIPQSSAKARS